MVYEGNPGLAGFYIPFITDLIASVSSQYNVVALAQSHLGHAPVPESDVPKDSPRHAHGLSDQVKSAVEAHDALREHCSAETKIVVIGHSVGCWILSQVCSMLFWVVSQWSNLDWNV